MIILLLIKALDAPHTILIWFCWSFIWKKINLFWSIYFGFFDGVVVKYLILAEHLIVFAKGFNVTGAWFHKRVPRLQLSKQASKNWVLKAKQEYVLQGIMYYI